MTRAKAIKAICLDCCGGSKTSVRRCPLVDCPLWVYRFGRTPRGGYSVFLDRDFYEAYPHMEQAGFNQLLLAEAHQRGINAKKPTDG